MPACRVCGIELGAGFSGYAMSCYRCGTRDPTSRRAAPFSPAQLGVPGAARATGRGSMMFALLAIAVGAAVYVGMRSDDEPKHPERRAAHKTPQRNPDEAAAAKAKSPVMPPTALPLPPPPDPYSAAVAAITPGVRACYDRANKAHPDMPDNAIIKLRIAGNGKVQSLLGFVRSEIRNGDRDEISWDRSLSPIEGCVFGAVKGQTFPESADHKPYLFDVHVAFKRP